MFSSRVLLLFLTTSLLSVWADDDWPRWRGPSSDGSIAASFPQNPGLNVAWTQELGSGYSSISIAEGKAVTGYSDGVDDYMAAFDARTGKKLWAYKICPTYKGHSGSHDGTIASPAISGGKVFGTSAWGHFFALDLNNGKPLWSLHLADDLGGVAPTYGFGSSPLVHGNLVMLHTGVEKDGAIAAFEVDSGKKQWSFGSGKIRYQSLELAEMHGEPHLLAGVAGSLYGLNPKTGEQLWSFAHGNERAGIDPLPIEGNRIFFGPSRDEGAMIRIDREGGAYKTNELWRTNVVKGGSMPPLYHKGFIFNLSRGVLVAMNAEDGKRAWRSRTPGVEFMIRAGDYLLGQNLDDGKLHMIEASGDAYRQKLEFNVFDHYSYSPPSYADGHIYMRSLEKIAAIKVGKATVELAQHTPEGFFPKSRFGAFIEELGSASGNQRKEMVDRYLANHDQGPIIEDKMVHLVYRGKADDVAVSGDFLIMNEVAAMNKVEGADLFYYSFEMPMGGMMTYHMVENFEKTMPDPRNPHKTIDGKKSVVSMPGWPATTWLQPMDGETGSLKEVEFKSVKSEKPRALQVYLPHGYEKGKQRYPVLYVQNGHEVIESMKMSDMLDNLIAARRMEPVVAVFIGGTWQDHMDDGRVAYQKMLAEELVGFVDSKWRTRSEADQRVLFGARDAGATGLQLALTHPDVFAGAAAQSAYVDSGILAEMTAGAGAAKGSNPRFYMDWGVYERVGGIYQFNLVDNNRKLVEVLKAGGFPVVDNETPTGTGGPAWQSRFARLVSEFFPIAEH